MGVNQDISEVSCSVLEQQVQSIVVGNIDLLGTLAACSMVAAVQTFVDFPNRQMALLLACSFL